MPGELDARSFFAALDAVRIQRGLRWSQVAKAANVSASTLTRLGQGSRPDLDSLLRLAVWGGLKIDEYVTGRADREKNGDTALAMVSTYLKALPDLTPEASDALDSIVKAAYSKLRDGS